MVIRSLLFAVAFYVVTGLYLVLGSPLLLGPRRWAIAALLAHARTCLWLQRVIVGTRLEVRGRERLLPGPILVAAKHQSAWDTFGLLPLFRDPALVMKAELLRIPLYGAFSRKFGMIPISREEGTRALREMLRRAKAAAAEKREILIFPEGTRRLPGAPPAYKRGAVPLYETLGLPCVPIALNSGHFWPRRSLLRRPGTIVVEILEPIPAGLPRTAFMAELERRIETASDRLLREALGEPPRTD